MPENERNSWLESNVLEEDFEIVKGSAYRIRTAEKEFSDYFVLVNDVDFDEKQVIVYIITRSTSYGVSKNFSDNLVENVSLREFRRVNCGVTGVLWVGESYSCLLPELDGSTIQITIKSVNSEKNSVSLQTKWNHSFFRDVFWENHKLNVEYASKFYGFVVRKDSEDELITHSDLMTENPEQYLFKFPVKALSEENITAVDKNVSYLVFVSGLHNEEVRFRIGYINLDKEVSWLDLETSKEFNSYKIPNEFVKIDCVPDELWADELVFTKEELENGKNVKTCSIPNIFSSEPTELIQVTVDSITNGGQTISFKVKHIDVSSVFDEIVKLIGRDDSNISEASSMLDVFGSEKVVDLFLIHPDAFVEIVNAAGENSWRAFYVLGFEKVADLFVSNPGAFVEIANNTGELSSQVFSSLENERVAERFLDYCNKRISFDQFMATVLSSDSFAIELGRPLDDLHFQQEKREQYLDSLSNLQVFGLLNSNPEFFYTSSNHMLFDRLKTDLGDKSITQLFEEYALIGSATSRNFLFRAITYDRFYGKENSLLTESDINALLPTLLEPLNSDKFDEVYFFLLANAIVDINEVPEVIDQVKPIYERRLQEGVNDKELKAAFEFIAVLVEEETSLVSEDKKELIRKLDEKSIFNPSLYQNNGKITVLQVFDKGDTGKDHWPMTQDWFNAYFENKPVIGVNGELVYETAEVKMILFMGDVYSQNREFIRRQFQETPNMIVTFRGHSYSLSSSFPFDIFGNIDSHILFIPGSCGSAGSTPNYIFANPKTDLRFISNSSTGRGQVTNIIVEALIESEEKSFQNVIADSTESIVKYGVSITNIEIWTRGELLMAYVLDETRQ